MRLIGFLGLMIALTACAVPTAMPARTPIPTASASTTATATVTVAPTTMPSATPTPAPKPFRIVGYLTDGDGIVDPKQLDKVTHVNYAFLLPREDGTVIAVANDWKLQQLVQLAHQKNVRVLISVGGWGTDAQFEALAAKPAARAVFVSAVQAMVKKYGLDGIDVDWEYPKAGASSQNYTALLRELRAAAPQQLLTVAVAALGENADTVASDIFEMVDFVNVMVYDGGQGAAHSPYSYAEQALAYWQQRGLAQNKIVLGVPFYSRPNQVPYRKLVAGNDAAVNADETHYLGDDEFYNGVPTIRRKTELARQRASGVMIWTLSYDATGPASLLDAVYQTAHR